ncbi:uncharacterized protein LOC114828003 [Galendromus occidentalis]|uniref:Uncharacterized protein LOC114828003 n=1 Tax=Galendromus occidentalis TaxID=34638 RepID=A0AAJ7WGM0_9ACAR|nr:uncharacterized protein LOC114828003 [Galendromus occidentalis]
MGGFVIRYVLLSVSIVAEVVSGTGEIHSNEGGKFAEFKNQTEYAEMELRRDLTLTAADEVHLSNIALQIKDGHIFNVTFQVKRNLVCSIVVHERDDDRPMEVLKSNDKLSNCIEQPASTTEADQSMEIDSLNPSLV